MPIVLKAVVRFSSLLPSLSSICYNQLAFQQLKNQPDKSDSNSAEIYFVHKTLCSFLVVDFVLHNEILYTVKNYTCYFLL